MQESASIRAREAAASRELAERLDTLSQPLAERILGRAIEIQHEEDAAETSIDYDDLRDIALEVGIPEEALERALLEELETERDHNATRLEQLTAPEHVRGGTVVSGERSEVERRLREYFEATGGYELLRRDEVMEWGRRHRRTPVAIVAATTTNQRRPGTQLLELDFNTAAGRKRARRLALAAIVVGAVFGGTLGGLAVLGGIGVGIVAGVAGAMSWLRRVTKSARRTINAALDAAAGDRDESRAPETWLDLWESQRP